MCRSVVIQAHLTPLKICGNIYYNHRPIMKVSEHYLYHTWNGMVRRCRDPKCVSYPSYGARGVDVYEDWSIKGKHGTTKPPAGFLCWLEYVMNNLGDRPEGYTLDRIDSNGDYEPGNIRWANITTQNINRKNGDTYLKCIRKTKSGKYQVNICRDKKTMYYGTYGSIEEAIMVRDKHYTRE